MERFLALILMFSAGLASVRSQLSMTWNGILVTGPILIYYDELLIESCPATPVGDPNRMGALVCTSAPQPLSAGVLRWHCPFRCSVVTSIRGSRSGNAAQIVRVRDGPSNTDPDSNGLWSCRLNSSLNGAIHVGLYQRGEGRGEINNLDICYSLSSSGFSLRGDSSGGPPEIYTWSRDGTVINGTDSSFSISIALNGNSLQTNTESRYRSTLTVAENLTGIYQYSVSNRATPTMLTRTVNTTNIQLPGNLAAQQIGLNHVEVSWSAASILICDYYQVVVDNHADFYGGLQLHRVSTESTNTSLYTAVGEHNIQLIVHNILLDEVEVVVRDAIPSHVSISVVTSSTVTLSWSQSNFSLPVTEYTVSLMRDTGNGQALCPSIEHNRAAVMTTNTSITVSDLEEFSTYIVTVTSSFNAFNRSYTRSGSTDFTTLSSVPTAAPQGLTAPLHLITSRSVGLAWDSVECIERNGIVFYYTVEIREQGETRNPGVAMQRNFTADRLTPFTLYTFRVAGVTISGSGPLSEPITVQTGEDVPGPVSNLRSMVNLNSVVISWSVPQESNGVIGGYEVTFRINDSEILTNSTSFTNFSILALSPQTRVSNISVSAHTGIGLGEAVTLPNLVTLSEPPMVGNVEVVIVSRGSVRVSWDHVVTLSEIRGYIVYYREARNGSQEEERNTVHVTNTTIIDGLMNGELYTFQVAAMADLGTGVTALGERSIAREVLVTTNTQNVNCTTSAPPMCELGLNLTVSRLTATSATLSWSQPVFSLPVTEYIVLLTRVTGSGQALCPSVEDSRTAVTNASTSTTIVDLEEFSTYTATVIPTSNDASIPATIDFTTDTTIPSGEPQNFTVELVTSRSVGLAWDSIECIERNGIVVYYAVEIQEQGETRNPGVATRESFTADGLIPYTLYTFRVSGVTISGSGPPSRPVTVRTEEDVPGPVSSLRSTLTLNSVVLTWSAPQEPNGLVVDYEVTYRVNESNMITMSTAATTFSITSLTPHTRVYNVSVVARTGAGLGETATLPDLVTPRKPSAVRNVVVEAVSDNSVRVSWDSVALPEIEGYIIYYRQIGEEEEEEEVVNTAATNAVTISGLRSNALYSFRVAAVAGAGNNNVLVGEQSTGSRVLVTTTSLISQDIYIRDVSISAIFAALLATMLTSAVATGIAIACHPRRKY